MRQVGNLLDGLTARRSNRSSDPGQIGGFVAACFRLRPDGSWHQIRAVGFDEQTVVRDQRHDVVQISATALVADPARDADIKIHRQIGFECGPIVGKTVDDGLGQPRSGVLQNRQETLMRLPLVQESRETVRGGDVQLFAKRLFLHIARRDIAKKIETGFADCDDLPSPRSRIDLSPKRRRPVVRVVRMQTRRGVALRIVPGQFYGGCVAVCVASGNDQTLDASLPRPLEYGIAVFVKAFVGQVGANIGQRHVTVYSQWDKPYSLAVPARCLWFRGPAVQVFVVGRHRFATLAALRSRAGARPRFSCLHHQGSRMRYRIGLIAALVGLLMVSSIAAAATQYVSDELSINMRRGPGTSYRITKLLDAGEQLQTLSEDNGWTQIRDSSGSMGYVLTRFLSGEPAARTQIEQMKTQTSKLQTENSELKSELSEALNGSKELGNTKRELVEENKSLSSQLQQIRETSADAIRISDENEKFREQLMSMRSDNERLRHENEALQSRREGMKIGALIMIGGIVVGLLLPLFRKRRKGSWDSL